MTGPEHYQAAEKEMQWASTSDASEAYHLGMAQVHATLALAAATAIQPSEYSVGRAEWRAWKEACSVPPDAAERAL